MKREIEGLLPVDPIGAFNKIKQNYLRYFETTYQFEKRFDGDELDTLKNTKMRLDNSLFHEYPYCEVIPEYVSEGKTLSQIIKECEDVSEKLPKHYADIIQSGLMGIKYYPYEHQFNSLVTSFIKKRNIVITSGTGSGKTESFMLPLLASLLKEMEEWPEQNGYDNEWFSPKDGSGDKKDRYDGAYQRAGESSKRSAALRALIMYPMNALVEDQIARLRKAIDSDEVRALLDKHFGRNRIFFGQYNSSTIGHKSLDKIVEADDSEKIRCLQKLSRIVKNYGQLLEREKTLKRQKDSLESELNYNPSEERRNEINTIIADTDRELEKLKEAHYIAPRLSTTGFSGEMVTRWDMQAKAPDILITNFSMLSAMMMRSSEEKMFEDTRKWFEVKTEADKDLTDAQRREEKKKRVFHLILDELHLYRGTSGTEVAYLIRSFLNEIGVPPVIENEEGKKIPNPQLRIIASSASLDDPQDFLTQFFGVYDEEYPDQELFSMIDGSDYTPKDLKLGSDFYTKFKLFAEQDEEGGLRYIDDPGCRGRIKAQFIRDINDEEVDSISSFIHKYGEQIFYDFKEVCKIKDTSSPKGFRFVPKALNEFIEHIFHSEDALRGFFVFRADEEVKNSFLPRIRFHQFFKYVEGLWGELTSAVQNNHQKVIEDVMFTPKELIKRENSVHRVLELLRCECCGSLFIGGNKRKIDADSFYLTLNYPELEEIPNRAPTPMVQNKRYSDYAVFWPEESSRIIADFVPIGADGTFSQTAAAFNSEWKRAYLNPVDGEVTVHAGPDFGQFAGWIKGYTYVITQKGLGPKENEVLALPCLCPHCNKDYRYREYTKSPIRSFRSGIDRSNQWICKELFYQLPKDNRKLIGFSDSRQDAAEQASLIANEHYRDMVRLLFSECISERKQSRLEDLKRLVILLINQKCETKFILDTIDNYNGVEDAIKNKLTQFAQRQDVISISGMRDDNRVIPLSNFVKSGNQTLGGSLVAKLLDLGINPSGTAHADQKINNRHWSSFYDFKNKSANQNIPGEVADNVRRRLTAAIFHNSFGQYMKVNSEEAGLGYVGILLFNETTRDYNDLKGYLNCVGIDIKEFLNGYVRVLGDHYRYDDPDSKEKINNDADPNDIVIRRNNWDSFEKYSGVTKKPIEKLTALIQQAGGSVKITELGNLVHSVLESCGIIQAELKLDTLGFYKVDDDDNYYECPRCHRVHLHRGMGFCTNTACLHELPNADNPSGTVGQLHEKNYISYDIKEEPREACRIHTEELTGQTDNQAGRLLEFKGIILDDPGHAITREIDMINVTTTMEVGVDIGGLLAVFQGNMPPTRYNYQQRVGRGGRRGQPFSTAITFCRGRSHDVYYYSKAIAEMLGSKPKSPKLSIRPAIINGDVTFNDEIVKRVIIKQILHLAMKKHFTDSLDIDPNDIHGEFGLVKNWNSCIKPYLIDWIDRKTAEVGNVVHYYLDQYNKDECLEQSIRALITWFTGPTCRSSESGFIKSVDAAVDTSSCAGLGQCLAEAGYLPIYGMPSNSRVLYHGYEDGDVRKIDRSIEQSITEFAPGAVKTKDHGYYTSAGLTTSFEMKPYKSKDGVLKVDNRRWDALEYCYGMSKDPSGRITSISQRIERIADVEGAGRIPLIVPKAYRTNRLYGNRGRKSDNNDKGNYTQASIWADSSNATDTTTKILPNANVVYWNCGDHSRPTVWFINDNNGVLFKGKSFFVTEHRPDRNRVEHKYVSEDSPKHISLNIDKVKNIDVFPSFLVEIPWTNSDRKQQVVYESNNQGEVSHSIALGAKKTTEMICISVRSFKNALNLQVNGPAPGYIPGIMAAFYSAASLIQRVFADEIDIQPDEIEISEIKIDDNNVPCIYLSDALPNGSGYVRMLMQEENGKTHLQFLMERIVSFEGDYLQSILKHGDQCRTSCPICLRTYQNSGYHHILDWRLGVDLIKLMLDPNYQMGYNNLADTPYLDLEEQMRIAGKMVTDNNDQVRLLFENRRFYLISTSSFDKAKKETIVHPLWNHDPKQDQNLFELLRTGYKTKPNALTINQIAPAPQEGDNVEFEF